MANKSYLDYEGLSLYHSLLEEEFAPIQAIQFKGTVTNVSDLPAVATTTIGSMYNITESGVSTADFVEGAGKVVRNGTNVVAINTAAAGEAAVMKWDIIAGVFDISDKLTFGSTMPASPADGDTFLYMGNTSYAYNKVTLEATDNPHDMGLYEYDNSTEQYSLTADTEPASGKDYFEKVEEYVKGVIYVYNESAGEWIAQSSGDTFNPITEQEIRSLFS